jgi:UDP-3-O-[3-hydroxymyristoyl] glucosamine N-acyltransferase
MSRNDSSRPLVLLGSNSNILKLVELAESCGVPLAGIIDDDYHGQGQYKDIPVIAREQDIAKFAHTHQFLCATNWTPDPGSARNREKRTRQLTLITQNNLPLATLISPLAAVSEYSVIQAGTIVYAFASVEPEVVVGQHSILYDYSIVGHESRVGHNVVLQRHVLVTSLVTVENNVYMGLCSRAGRSGTTLGNGTFVHPNIMILRGTDPNEVVSLASRKTYPEVIVE